MPSLTVFQIPQVIQTTRAGATGVNSATNKIDFDVSKNISNEIEFLLKDIDRKPISLANKNVIIFVVDAANQTVKLQKTLQVINEQRGHCRLTISPYDIMDWDLTHYSYSLVIQRPDMTQVLLYCDQNRSQYGYMLVKQGPLPMNQTSIELLDVDFMRHTYGVSNQPISGVPYRVSGGYVGAAQRDNRLKMHTCAIYCQDFLGTFRVQASLDNSKPTDDLGWFDVEDSTVTINHLTGLTSMTFQGSLMWVRFLYIPDPLNTGAITKVLFKN